MPVLLQVTLGAGATQVSPKGVSCKQITIQNNATHQVRVGDSTVSATKGVLLSPGNPGGAFNTGAVSLYADILSLYYLFGTAGDVIDVLYVPD